MLSVAILIFSTAAFGAAYKFYGDFLFRKLRVSDASECPSKRLRDGMDYVPAKAPVLMGHHFSSIAGAGPIVGPVMALAFGWLPALLWIVLGSIFIGGVHDLCALIASARNDGLSIGHIIERSVGKKAKSVFLLFTLCTLIVVLAVFARIIAASFVQYPQTATASVLFMPCAVIFGILNYVARLNLTANTVAGLLLISGAVYAGFLWPFTLPADAWIWILLAYAFLAALLPVWLLLQPRDYLNSFILYLITGAAVTGIIIFAPKVNMPAFTSLNTDLGPLAPMLFITVACGAVSGFHSIVASGTTAKQLARETDARFVAYGSMLVEGLLAVCALVAGAALTRDEFFAAGTGGMANPVGVFASGIGVFMSVFGIPKETGAVMTALAISAFALTSFDTCARLARFCVEELIGIHTMNLKKTPLVAARSGITLMIVAAAALMCFSGSAAVLWPVFGTANQLLAALALLAVSAWLKKQGIPNFFALAPTVFMFCVTTMSLIIICMKNLFGTQPNMIIGCTGISLLALSVFLLAEALRPQ